MVGIVVGKEITKKAFTATSIKHLKRTGMHADSKQRGLYLQVTQKQNSHNVSKSWLFRFTSPITNKRREMGLGPFPIRSLSDARNLAATYQRQVLDGIDPIEDLKAKKFEEQRNLASKLIFKTAAEQYIKVKKPEWTNPKHAQQWRNTLDCYANPVLGDFSVDEITTTDVLSVLEPIWTTKHETATRVRQRIESILDWCIARGSRSKINPASMKGNLSELLPRTSKIKQVEHHPAVPFEEAPDFFKSVSTKRGVAPQALLFLLLTGSRSNEVLGMTWSEVDQTKNIWIIPKERMKTRQEHRVPLSRQALSILTRSQNNQLNPKPTDYVFPNPSGKRLSSAALLSVMKKMAAPFNQYVPHGLRSTFRDWGAETTNTPNEVLEMALAHTIKNKAESAYRRGDLLEKRRKLMNQWGKYLHD